MHKIILLSGLFMSFISFGQIKQIALSELTVGSGMFFGAEMNNGTGILTVTFKGPSDRYIALGLGSGVGMGSGDVLMYSNATGSNTVADHYLAGGTTPPTDTQQDWTITSNTVTTGVRTIIATRAFNTGDPNDFAISFSDVSLPLFWAKSASASTSVSYHGGANRAAGITRNWVLVDTSPPTLSSTSPVNGAVGVNVANNLTAVFSENITFASNGIELRDGSNNLIETFTNGSNATITTNTLTLNPTTNLVLNTTYQIIIPGNALTDLAGNAFAGISAGNWLFNTNDLIAPTLVTQNPSNNANITNLSSNVIGTFSENIQFGAGTIQLLDENNALLETFVNASNATISGNTLTLNPTSDFNINQTYTIAIAGNALSDLSGNAYAGTMNNWTFTTNDLIAPTIATLSPTDNSIGVGIANSFTVSFSEIVQWGTGSISLFDASNTLIESFDNTSLNASITGTDLTITPSSLQPNTSYYFLISSTAISDTSGNFFAGISSNSTWNFSTISTNAPALIVSPFNPIDNEINAPETPSFSIAFDQNISLNLMSYLEIWNVQSGGLFDQISAGSISVNGNLLTFNVFPALTSNTTYAVTIPSDLVKNGNNQYFAGIADFTTWNFTVGDFIYPTFTTQSPTDDFTSFPVSSSILATFTEPVSWGNGAIILMDVSNSTVHSTYSSTVNAAQVSFVSNGMTLIPTPALIGNTDYAILIENDALVDTSLNHNAVPGISTLTGWNFRTESQAGLNTLQEANFTWNGTVFTVSNPSTSLKLFALDGSLILFSNNETLHCESIKPGIYLVKWDNETRMILK